MNNDKQMEEYETSFYNFIFEEEDNKELKKNDLKELQNFISRNIRVWLFKRVYISLHFLPILLED